MSPVLLNILVAFFSLIYVFSVVGIMDYFVKKGFPQDISRKIIHIAAASWLLFWILFDQSHWTKYLNILPALVWTVLLIQKGLYASHNDDAVKTMTRTGDKAELLRGPLYFTLVMNIMGTAFFYTEYAIITMGILGWGDGLAPYIGQKFGKIEYNIFSKKTLEGSLAVLVFGALGAVLFSSILLGSIDFTKIIILSLFAVVIEGLSPKDLDNIFIPVGTFVLYSILW